MNGIISDRNDPGVSQESVKNTLNPWLYGEYVNKISRFQDRLNNCADLGIEVLKMTLLCLSQIRGRDLGL